MVNQNENQNEFVLVLGPYNENGLRFRSSGESYQNEFVLVFVLVNHKDQPEPDPHGNQNENENESHFRNFLLKSEHKVRFCYNDQKTKTNFVFVFVLITTNPVTIEK